MMSSKTQRLYSSTKNQEIAQSSSTVDDDDDDDNKIHESFFTTSISVYHKKGSTFSDMATDNSNDEDWKNDYRKIIWPSKKPDANLKPKVKRLFTPHSTTMEEESSVLDSHNYKDDFLEHPYGWIKQAAQEGQFVQTIEHKVEDNFLTNISYLVRGGQSRNSVKDRAKSFEKKPQQDLNESFTRLKTNSQMATAWHRSLKEKLKVNEIEHGLKRRSSSIGRVNTRDWELRIREASQERLSNQNSACGGKLNSNLALKKASNSEFKKKTNDALSNDNTNVRQMDLILPSPITPNFEVAPDRVSRKDAENNSIKSNGQRQSTNTIQNVIDKRPEYRNKPINQLINRGQITKSPSCNSVPKLVQKKGNDIDRSRKHAHDASSGHRIAISKGVVDTMTPVQGMSQKANHATSIKLNNVSKEKDVNTDTCLLPLPVSNLWFSQEKAKSPVDVHNYVSAPLPILAGWYKET